MCLAVSNLPSSRFPSPNYPASVAAFMPKTNQQPVGGGEEKKEQKREKKKKMKEK